MDAILHNFRDYFSKIIVQLQGRTDGKLLGEDSVVQAMVISNCYNYALEEPLFVGANGRALDLQLSMNSTCYSLEFKYHHSSINTKVMGRIINDLVKLRRHRNDHDHDNEHHGLIIVGTGNSDLHDQIGMDQVYLQKYRRLFPAGDGWVHVQGISLFFDGLILDQTDWRCQVHTSALSEYQNTLFACFQDAGKIQLDYVYRHYPQQEGYPFSISCFKLTN